MTPTGQVNPADAKDQAVRQWTLEPAGAVLAGDLPRGSPGFFEAVEKTRYELYPWLRDSYLTEQHRWRDRRVLEVGVGLGTDHIQLVRAGAHLAGVDLTPESIKQTRQRVELCHATSDLQVADAEALPFSTGEFDAVYSFGVLHHTPDMRKAITEVHRVLRPGGTAVIGLYNRHSLFYLSVILRYTFGLQWRHQSLAERRAEIEYGAGTPVVIVSSARDLRSAFSAFAAVRVTAWHVPRHKLPGWAARVMLPNSVERRLGWYWMVEATKPG